MEQHEHFLLSLFIVEILMSMIPEVRSQIMPTGCTYDSGMFECDYSSLTTNGDIPLQASAFDPIPQRLRLINLPATLTSSIFDSDFSTLSPANYDINYPATLELKCSNSSQTTTVASPFLGNMSHVQNFRIINCALGNIPAGAFAELGSLDRFSIENGSIVSMAAGMLNGVFISKNDSAYPSYPSHKGEFSIKHTKLSGTLPADFLSSQTSVNTIILDGLGLTSISSTQFASNTNLRFLSLGWNDFTEIPSGIFDGLTSLTEVRLYDTTVSCSSCDDLWFLAYAQDNYVSLYGDVICQDGTYAGKYAMTYYNEVCASAVTEECAGLKLANTCLTWLNIGINIVIFLAFVLSWVVLALAVSIRGQLNPGSSSKSPNKSRKTAPALPKKGGPVNAKRGWT